jgi:L-fucose isomerase-like protein
LKSRTTLGVIVGNRGFFPDGVVGEGRTQVLKALHEEGFETVCLSAEDTKLGAVETFHDAQACANLFRDNKEKIDGIVISLPNFGDERGIANAIRLSGLHVPVLVQAFPDDLAHFAIGSRRDSFCGKFSVCSNLMQYGIPFSLTEKHTVLPGSEGFRRDARKFGAICRIIRGLENVRFGAVGTRPPSFNTVRYSERILEAAGISIEVLDIAELLRQAEALSDGEPALLAKVDSIQKYALASHVPAKALGSMARLGVVLDRWIAENGLAGTAIQCWTTLQEYAGVVPCTLMSMMGTDLLPSACEVDVAGLLGMYILQAASGSPSAIVDWNNNYQDSDVKCVLFHCSNFPKEFYETVPSMDRHEILASVLPIDATWGTLQGRIKSGPMTYLRVSTDDTSGKMIAYTGHAQSTNDPAMTWGGIGVIEVPQLQGLLRYICKNNFEHHVAINMSETAEAVLEALRDYRRWDIYGHEMSSQP